MKQEWGILETKSRGKVQGARGKDRCQVSGGTVMERSFAVKICGITDINNAQLAAESGADFLGVLVEVAISPRSKTIIQAKGIFDATFLPTVALVHEMSLERIEYLISELDPFAIQFLGEQDINVINLLKQNFPHIHMWQSLHLPAGEAFDIKQVASDAENYIDAGVDVIVLDTAVETGVKKQYGGTGQTNNWELVKELIPLIKVPVLLAGGLNPENVQKALLTTNSIGIDVSSGVEVIKGEKDPEKLRLLISQVRELEKRKGF